jgi:hypothetical protein
LVCVGIAIGLYPRSLNGLVFIPNQIPTRFVFPSRTETIVSEDSQTVNGKCADRPDLDRVDVQGICKRLPLVSAATVLGVPLKPLQRCIQYIGLRVRCKC